MAGRLQGKRVVVTDASEFMGPDIVALFREEGGEVIADARDLRQPGACEALIVEAGDVDVLMVNLAGASSGKAVDEVQDAELDMLLDPTGPPTASPHARRAAADARPTQRQDRGGRQRHRAARTAAPCRLFRRPRRAARLCAIGSGRGRGVRCERDCDRANLRGEPDLLSTELPGDRGFQAAYARRAGRAALDGDARRPCSCWLSPGRRATGSSAKSFLTPAAG